MATHFCEVPDSAYVAWNSEKLPHSLNFPPKDSVDTNILVLAGRDPVDSRLDFRALRPNQTNAPESDSYVLQSLISIDRTSPPKALKWCGKHTNENISSLYPDGFVAIATEDLLDLYDPHKALLGYQHTCEQSQLTVPTPVRAREDYGIVTRLRLDTEKGDKGLTCFDFDLVDSLRVAEGTSQGVVNVFDAVTGQLATTIEAVSQSAPTPITSLQWHPVTADVLGATCANGTFHVLKGKSRKPLLTLTDPNKRHLISGCVWFEMGKNVVLAYDEDKNSSSFKPVLQLWDLRHTAYPLREVTSHHKRGIVGIDICRADQRFFTTASRDGTCVTWAMANQNIIPYSELHLLEGITDFSVFQAGPFGAVACQQANDTISIHSIDSSLCREAGSLRFAPNWLQPPQNAIDFGFGGQLAWFWAQEQQVDTVLSAFVTADEAFVQTIDQFAAFMEHHDLVGFCEERARECRSQDPHEARIWEAMSAHAMPPERRTAYVLRKLGNDQETVQQQITGFLGHEGGHGLLSEYRDMDQAAPVAPVPLSQHELFDQSQDVQDTTTFFEGLADSTERHEEGDDVFQERDSDIVGSLQATQIESNKEGIFIASGQEAWKTVPLKFLKQAFLMGNPLAAIEIALEARRFAEAFILANSIQDATITRAVIRAYVEFTRDPFISMLALSADQSYAEVIQTCNLSQWEEVMTFFVTYVYKPEVMHDKQFTELAIMLGRRLESDGDLRAATLVYLYAGAFEEALRIISSMPSPNRRSGCTALKIIVLRAINNQLRIDSSCVPKLSMFLDRLVNNGRLKLAQYVIELVKGGLSDTDNHHLRVPISLLDQNHLSMQQTAGMVGSQSMSMEMATSIPSPMALGQQQYRTSSQGVPTHATANMMQLSYTSPQTAPRETSISPMPVFGAGKGGVCGPAPLPQSSGLHLNSGPAATPAGLVRMTKYGPAPVMGKQPIRPVSSLSPHVPLMTSQPMGLEPYPSVTPQPLPTQQQAGMPPMTMPHHQQAGVPQMGMPPHHHQPVTMPHPQQAGMPQMGILPPGMPPVTMPHQQPGMSHMGMPPHQQSGMPPMTIPSQQQSTNPHPVMPSQSSFPPHLGIPPHPNLPPPSMPSQQQGLPPPSGLPNGLGMQSGGQVPNTDAHQIKTGFAFRSSSGSQGGLGAIPRVPSESGSRSCSPQSGINPIGPGCHGLQPDLNAQTGKGSQSLLKDGQRVIPSTQSHSVILPPTAGQNNARFDFRIKPTLTGNTPFAQPHTAADASPSMGMSPPMSTHPAASITPTLQEGLPHPWPIPTEAQQKRSTTSANEELNQRIQQASTPSGIACPPGDVQRIREIISAHIINAGAPGESTSNKSALDDLCDQLSQGRLLQDWQDKIHEYVRACEQSDTQTMQRVTQELTAKAWTKETKLWLVALRRLSKSGSI